MSRSTKKISVAIITQDINLGDVINEDDIEFVKVSYDKTISDGVITQSDFARKKLIARVDLSSSDILTKSNTLRSSTLEGLQSLSLGLTYDRANGGDLKKGDRIDIWQTGDDARLVAKNISVRNVIQPNKRLGISTSQMITVVIAVSSDQARDLSIVVGSNDVMIVLSTGSQPSHPTNIANEQNQNSSEFQSLNQGIELTKDKG